MKVKQGIGFARISCLMLMILLGLLRPALGAEPDLEPGAAGKPEVGTANDPDFLRSYLRIQEQLHDAQSAIQKIRQETVTANTSNSVMLDERLRLMERAIADERLEQLNGIAHLNRTILIAAGAFAFVGFLVVLLSAFLQWAALNRLAVAAANLSAGRSSATLIGSDAFLPQVTSMERPDIRLLELMERMEQRLHKVETSVKLPETHANDNSTNGSAAKSSSLEISPSAVSDQATTINLLLNKSQTLVKLDKPQAALECLDEVLVLAPDNADALVKKGAVLERLQRLSEAIECYELALSHNPAMVVAYLYKAGLLSRMGRNSEALACYDQALKSDKVATAEV